MGHSGVSIYLRAACVLEGEVLDAVSGVGGGEVALVRKSAMYLVAGYN